MQRILELAPDHLESYDKLIKLWLERSQAKRAEGFARKLVELDPERGESHELLAHVLTDLGDEERAIDSFRKAADAWIAHGMEDRARAILQRHVPSEPFDFGGVTDPIELGSMAAAAREAESPFGEEGIGGEPAVVADEFTFVGGEDLLAEEAESPAPLPVVPAAKPPEPVAAPAAPAASAAAGELEEPADVEQLLAEAGVYLRYGKRERAVASLELLLAREPDHLAALELLGDAYAGAEDTARAVEAWTRAAHRAIAAGDATRVATLRGRIEVIDAAAAAALPAPAEPPRASAAATMLFEAPAAPEADAAADDSGSPDEIEIDIDAAEFGDATDESAADETGTFGADIEEVSGVPQGDVETAEADAAAGDVEIEIDADAFIQTLDEGGVDAAAEEPVAIESESLAAIEPAGDTAPLDEPEIPGHFEVAPARDDAAVEPFEAPAPFAVGAEHDEAPELEVASEAPLALEVHPQPEAPAAPEPEAAAAQVPAAARAPGDLSSTSSAEITEDLEEAAFYFEQGLLDEAEAIYQRVAQRAPNHPAALLRLGEIAVARGQDAATPVADVAQADAELAAAGASSAAAVQDIEPPDDLDLTAREFGPANPWQDEEDEGGAGAEAVTDAPPDLVQPDALQPDVAQREATGPGVAAAAESPAPELGAAPASIPEARAEALSEHELTAPDVSIAEDAGAPAFDLAAELSEALVDGAPATRAGASTDEDGFSSLFSEFKRGVSRTLGEGDVETHFDLGIAYREMGLLDDAIGEFHYALGSTVRRLDALHMMGLCALDVGRALDAIGHLEQALASPEVPAERETALRFDLGRAHEAQGDPDRALDAFGRVAELDAGFQDVAARIDALRSGLAAARADAAGRETGGEAYESFDDLVAEAADDAPAAALEEPVVAESYENFEEFSSDDGADDDGADTAEGADEASDGTAPDADAPREEVEAVAAAPEVAAEIESPEPPAAEPEPPVGAPRRRKVSFF